MVDHSVTSSVWQSALWAGMGKVASACRPYPFNLVKFERSLVSVAVMLSMNSLFIEVNICCQSLFERRKKEKKKERKKKKKKKKKNLFMYREAPARSYVVVVKSHGAKF